MKKAISLLMVILMLLMAIPALGEAEPEITEVNLLTMGHLIDWDMNITALKWKLEALNAEVFEEDDDQYGLTLNMEGQDDSLYYYYCFYFNNLTRVLRAIEGSVVLFNSGDDEKLIDALAESYGIADMESYESEFVNNYLSSFENSYSCADEDTIYMLGVNSESDDSYAIIDFLMLDRAFYEAQ